MAKLMVYLHRNLGSTRKIDIEELKTDDKYSFDGRKPINKILKGFSETNSRYGRHGGKGTIISIGWLN